MFCGVFKPVNRTLSLVAACVSLAGIVAGPAHVPRTNPLVFFGISCVLALTIWLLRANMSHA